MGIPFEIQGMIGLVIVTHGRLAEEFVSAMEHVVGPQAAVKAISGGEAELAVLGTVSLVFWALTCSQASASNVRFFSGDRRPTCSITRSLSAAPQVLRRSLLRCAG